MYEPMDETEALEQGKTAEDWKLTFTDLDRPDGTGRSKSSR
jgi:hypothetical protein